MREVNGSELLGGSDHEFVVNLYTVILNRWPDEDGYRHHLEKVENRPDIRRRVITDVANSAEARALGVVLRFEGDPPPPPPGQAPAAPGPRPAAQQAAAETDLAAALARLRAGLAAMPPADIAAAQRALAETLAALAVHQAERIEARLAALEARGGA
jgi:hypothetical protein